MEAIQVSLYVADEKTRQRELQALTEIREELKNGAAMAAAPELSMTVITDEGAGRIETVNGNIRITPLWKWLLGKSGCEVCQKKTRTLQRTPPN